MKDNASLDKKMKDMTETKNQLQQALIHEQKRSDNYCKLYEESKTEVSTLVNETNILKKDLESANRVQKQSATNHNSVEIRLNKAMEIIEKNKALMEKMEQKNREMALKEQKKMEEVVVDNKKLLKQKNDLLTGFKKQMMLIDVLKRQKIHLEAANVLQFTEDEFLKLLNWKSDQN
uniref:Testis-expressed sequence 9 protein n=1 Tax=Strigamia maritima TaxID=126957 RepID=T1J3T3_STRMM